MKKVFQIVCTILPALLLTLASCEEKDNAVDPVDEQPAPAGGTPTEIGKPQGAPVTQTIGPAGGAIALPNSRMVFRFPAGVITKATPITIQPVENKAFGGTGTAFEISPKELALNGDASVTWNYNEEDMGETVAEALGMAYQDEKGIWQGDPDVEVNKEAKTVTGKLSRLAHWSFYVQFYIKAEKDVLAPGESTQLTIYYHQDFDPNSLLYPLVPPKVLSASRIVKWTVNGNEAGAEIDGDYALNGQITEDKTYAKAQYDAPPREPDTNPVAVAVHIDTKHSGQLIILHNIRIDSPSNMKVDGQTDNNPMVGLTINGNSLGGVMNDAKGTKMMITFNIKGFHGKGTYEVNKESTVSITPSIFGDVPYIHGYYKDVSWISGGGKVTITEYNGAGKPMTGTISGNFFKVYISGAIETKVASAKFRTVPVVIN